jgi:hypothetical protein
LINENGNPSKQFIPVTEGIRICVLRNMPHVLGCKAATLLKEKGNDIF